MRSSFSIPYSRLVMALFAVGLIVTAFALFWITYLASKSIAEHEISRTAKSQSALTRLVVDQYFGQLENQIRSIASNPDIRAAIERRDLTSALQIADQATHGMNSAVLDILLIDLPDEPEWLNISLGLVDIGQHIPSKVRNALPPDLWVTYTNHDIDPEFMTAALSVSVLHPESGEMIGKIIGGVSITDSFVLPGLLAETLKVYNLGLFHENEMVAGLGEISADALPDIWPETLDETTSALREDMLYIATPLKTDIDGHVLSALIKLPVDTMQKVEETYVQLFPPFLLYTLLWAVGIAFVINQITSGGLRSLLTYASGLSRSSIPSPPVPGLIREFNQLAANFQHAFEVSRERDAQFRELIDGSMHGVYVHMNYRMLYANPVFWEILGYTSEDAKSFSGSSVLSLYDPDEHERLRTFYKLRERGQAPRFYEVKAVHKDGHVVWLEQHAQIIDWDGSKAYYVTATDISKRKQPQILTGLTAGHDVLTGLPNRHHFISEMAKALQNSDKSTQLSALMVLDLDRFKLINDSFGPAIGDTVIAAIAARLTETLGPSPTIARIGEDEFAVFFCNQTSIPKIEKTAENLLQSISKPVDLPNGTTLSVSASIGIAVAQPDYQDESLLLRLADTSMYQAKADGGGCYRTHENTAGKDPTRAVAIRSSLRKALDNSDLALGLQPILEGDTGKLIMCEAAASWHSDQLGLVAEAELFDATDGTDLANALFNWTLHHACDCARSLADGDLSVPAISVNVPAQLCSDPSFSAMIKSTLSSAGLSSSQLVLEVSGNLWSGHIAGLQGTFTKLAELGVRITLDQFGTQSASFEDLSQFPIHALKIDRALIQRAQQEPGERKLFTAIAASANSLGIQVICDGIDSLELCQLANSLGCPNVQGSYVAPVMVQSKFENFIKEKKINEPNATTTG